MSTSEAIKIVMIANRWNAVPSLHTSTETRYVLKDIWSCLCYLIPFSNDSLKSFRVQRWQVLILPWCCTGPLRYHRCKPASTDRAKAHHEHRRYHGSDFQFRESHSSPFLRLNQYPSRPPSNILDSSAFSRVHYINYRDAPTSQVACVDKTTICSQGKIDKRLTG